MADQPSPASEPAAELARLCEELERLRESERMYRASAELGGRLVWSADAQGKVLAISPAFKAVTGVDDEEVLKRGWIDSVHPDDRDLVVERWAHSLRTGDRFAVEFRAVLPDGSTRMALSRAVAVRDREGVIKRWYGSTEDIHEERLAELARRDVEERYRLAVQATNDAVWDYDIVAGTVDWSQNSSGIFGSAADPLGRTTIGWWEERIHPEDRRRVERSLRSAIARGDSRWTETYRFRRDDGSYADMLDRGFIIRDPAGKAVRAVGAMADLTDRHRAEAEIRRMQADLIHFSRLSAMGAMASTLAHELNQPLAAVSNFLSGARRLAAAEAGAQPELIAALDAAASGAHRAGEIVRRLREMVSRGAVAMDVEHLPTLVEEAGVLGFVDEKLRRVRHRTAIEEGAEWVRVDRIQIQQVLINLIRNAVEAMEQSIAREVLISARTVQAGLVEVSVADTGSGIAPELMEELFSQFMTTKSGGMGIGLPICRTIVEAHGGKIWAENRPGGGAVFRFTLPLGRQPTARAD
ncbi:MAG: PAS domain-containing protein [Pseudomonadota bacterium]|nr:PAS domain-containing protein [Pseudomonadota bacterium]